MAAGLAGESQSDGGRRWPCVRNPTSWRGLHGVPHAHAARRLAAAADGAALQSRLPTPYPRHRSRSTLIDVGLQKSPGPEGKYCSRRPKALLVMKWAAPFSFKPAASAAVSAAWFTPGIIR